MEIQKVSFSKVATKSVEYWRKTIIFQVVFSLFYFAIYITLALFLYDYYEVLDQLRNAISEYMMSNINVDIFLNEYTTILLSEEFRKVVLCMIVVSAILFPLNIGLLNIYHKLDNSEKISFRDLFAGYKGNNFFKFFLYALFWGIIYNFCKVNLLLMTFWILLTMLVGPLMFLKNISIFRALQLSLNAFRTNILSSLLILLLAVFGSYLGYLFLFIGTLFTFPFWNAVLYVFYKEAFIRNLHTTASDSLV